ncbi:hypothetical protein Tco_0026250 [Tanacetum coccineum]
MFDGELCIKTYLESSINDLLNFLCEVGVVTIRAKKIIGWILEFLEGPSNLESEQKEGMEIPADSDSNMEENNWDENDEEGVEDTFHNMHNAADDMKDVSLDLFGLNELIKRTTKDNILHNTLNIGGEEQIPSKDNDVNEAFDSIEETHNGKDDHETKENREELILDKESISSPDWMRPQTLEDFPRSLYVEQAEELEMPITHDEVKRAMWDCGSNKAPSLDGFTFNFSTEIFGESC